MPAKASLEAFVKENPTKRGATCWVCALPEVETINTAKRDRTATTVQMQRWLVEVCGYKPEDVTRGRLNNHFQSGHHLP